MNNEQLTMILRTLVHVAMDDKDVKAFPESEYVRGFHNGYKFAIEMLIDEVFRRVKDQEIEEMAKYFGEA